MNKLNPSNYNESGLCWKCKGRGFCGNACKILNNFKKFLPSLKTHFSGNSPPEIFVGTYNYPNVNTGILCPQNSDNTRDYAMPEIWHEKNFTINQILGLRAQLIYGRFKSNVKDVRKEKRVLETFKEIAMCSKPVSTEIFLEKKPTISFEVNSSYPVIGNPAPLKRARLEENPKIEKKVDYFVNDSDIKAGQALIELYSSKIEISSINKILSAGLLGRKTERKLVPTRWSITATDEIISKYLLKEIKNYSEISDILVFNSTYLGNHYEFLLLPDKFSFEVIEAKIPGSVWNSTKELILAIDYEGFNGRKTYASNVTGAYYANLLSLSEYLKKIKKQSSCLVIRECSPEYFAPCGVGVLREASRNAFSKKPDIFKNLNEAINTIQKRLKIPMEIFTQNSWLLKNYKKQKRLSQFFIKNKP